MKTAYLVCPKSQLSGYIHASDREYFSRPVLVEIVGHTDSGLLTVTDHARGHTYPCDPKVLKSLYQLTNRQRAQAQPCPTT
jgi:hypothetical protein